MREIKFRVWDKKYRTFDFNASPDLFISTDGEVFEKDERNYGMQTYIEYNKTDSYEISQYTGLKDKNGKEIYEGDIDKYSKTQVTYLLEEGGFSLARFDENGRVSSRTRLNNGNEKYLEIIGNIYENPEFLEKAK
jgi:uncharacterized phage protein (TIGR01671 family)